LRDIHTSSVDRLNVAQRSPPLSVLASWWVTASAFALRATADGSPNPIAFA
jgi:hypothetical protein